MKTIHSLVTSGINGPTNRQNNREAPSVHCTLRVIGGMSLRNTAEKLHQQVMFWCYDEKRRIILMWRVEYYKHSVRREVCSVCGVGSSSFIPKVTLQSRSRIIMSYCDVAMTEMTAKCFDHIILGTSKEIPPSRLKELLHRKKKNKASTVYSRYFRNTCL